VSHRFDRYHGLSLGFLSLIEPTNERFIANGKIGRFHKRPTEILIAVLGVPLAFAFAVADLLTAYTPAV
jgi:hypothetical protein